MRQYVLSYLGTYKHRVYYWLYLEISLFIARYFSEILLLIRESREFTTIANIAIRFKLEEMDPEGKARDMIKGGLLSGLPVDERFFYVFCECLVFGSVAVFIPYR